MQNVKVLGLLGERGSGKDTAAQVLVKAGWRTIAFADALYLEIAEAYKVPLELLKDRATKETPLPELALLNCQCAAFIEVVIDIEASPENSDEELRRAPRSPREILQYWGTNYRRQFFGENYWPRLVQHAIEAQPDVSWVVTDVRFRNEASLIAALGGEFARILGDQHKELPGDDENLKKTSLHVSELELAAYPVQKLFLNEFSPLGLARFQYAIALEYLGPTAATQEYFESYRRAAEKEAPTVLLDESLENKPAAELAAEIH